MSLTIRNAETVDMIQRLARESGSTAEDVVRRAMEAELLRQVEVDRIFRDVTRIQEEFASLPPTGLKADKAFFDDLGGNV
ncbi:MULTISPECIES: type II toxin-antitoxin system VapB family antitoxin [unclassified Aureimonas]|uniref:type II toxin-antitoxin system VapB family antitoxin n=1 Tax=unclassified Aureimonas TaxID=2615206 RepID=UPI0006F8EE5B|nr:MULTISPECIES: type II toxin-antitoxin system VapB family antitoxin [unclassified Aureimonas]KQT64284.1 hypothetical protein ASG62_04655 [Aureimonas sp. Leaf427]KQT81473.1 hypothetical protein ASG54_01920 [Aureimonas sp. Leaf460]